MHFAFSGAPRHRRRLRLREDLPRAQDPAGRRPRAGLRAEHADQYFCSLTNKERRLDPRDINLDHPSHIDFESRSSPPGAARPPAGPRPQLRLRSQRQTPDCIPVEPARVVVVEGLFILSHPLVRLFDLTVFLEVDADQRLIGRLLRDVDERDADIHWNIDRYQRFVRPGYDTFVKPTLLNANVVVDFTYRRRLFQELLVAAVRGYVDPRLRSLPQPNQPRPQRRLPARAEGRRAARAEPAPAALPTLWVADNPQLAEARRG